MSDRQGIEIDYCPKCRGVWLDRGELDKIIERSLGETVQTAATQPYRQQPAQPYPPQGYSDAGHGSGHGSGHGNSRRHGSFLGRLFD